MYPVSATYKDKIKPLDRVLQVKMQIQHSQGDLDLTDADIVQGSLIYNEASQAGDDFTVGGVVASDLRVELLNKPAYADLEFVGATLTCQIGLLVDEDEDTWEWVPLGVFNVDEVIGTKASRRLAIKAVDNLILFDKPYSLSQLSYPATLSQIFLDLCSVCDVLPGTVSFPNDSYVVQTRPDGDLTCRDVLGYVAELSGTFARATRAGKIELTWYEASGLTLTGANRFSFTPRDDVIQITGVMVTTDGVTYLAGGEGSAGIPETDVHTESGLDFETGTLVDVEAGEDGLVLAREVGGYTDNLIPQMTSNTTPEGGASASSQQGGTYQAYGAMDRNVNTYWCTDHVVAAWLQYEFAAPRRIMKYAVRTNHEWAPASPQDWTFEAWDGTQWVTLHTVTGQTGWATRERREFEISEQGMSATKYRLNVTANCGDVNTTVGEVEMMEAIAGDYAEIGARTSPPVALSGEGPLRISWQADVPGGTAVAVKCAVNDDGETMPDDAEFEAATNGGLVPGATGDLTGKYLWVRQILTTEDTSVTPTLESLRVYTPGIAGVPGYVVDLSDNPLLQSGYETALPAIYNAIKDTAFHPFESSWQGNPAVQAGDIITQVDRDLNEYPTLVTHSTYKYRGESTLEARGLPVTAKGFKGSTNKKIASIVRKVEAALGDRLSSLEQATLHATELIANMLGGHVIVGEDAIYICDAETLETSTKIWKWGLGGFGYSDDGGETYGTAITADGTIVAALVAAGIVTADMIQAGVLQSTDGSTTFNLDTGHVNIKNKVYFDTEKQKYVFDGLLSADTIEALKAQFDVVVSYTSITQVLYAERGNISELTVDQLDTSKMVANYLASDKSPISFIKIRDRDIEFLEGEVEPGSPTPTEQLTDRNGNSLYWTDLTHTGVTTDATAYPVTVYQYHLRRKLHLYFEIDEVTGYAIPRMTWGVGDDNGRTKAYMVKDQRGLRLQYETSAGVWHELCIGESGIEGTNAALTALDIYSDGMVSGYEDGTEYDWSWVKDVDGKITSITNNTTSKSATITWNAGAKPV